MKSIYKIIISFPFFILTCLYILHTHYIAQCLISKATGEVIIFRTLFYIKSQWLHGGVSNTVNMKFNIFLFKIFNLEDDMVIDFFHQFIYKNKRYW